MVKKLIEVALPLEKINAESAREKSIRHGHPSTLHLWWARRPLAAARAVIWSSLVDDPSSHPESFPTEEDQINERQRLFHILEELVAWENLNNKEVINAAKIEISKSVGEITPVLLDPFAGGGAIPLEAQRLGIRVYAHDLNPVAVMINKAMIEIPPKFVDKAPVNNEDRISRVANTWHGLQGLAADVEFYGKLLKNKAFHKIGNLYPKVALPKEQGGGTADVIAWIWTRTVVCPNPSCKCRMPLAKSFDLSKRSGGEAYVHPEYDEESKKIRYIVKNEKNTENISAKMSRGANFRCIVCGAPVSPNYVKEEAINNRLGVQMMAIVADMGKRRIYLSPNEEHELVAIVDKPKDIPTEPLPDDPRNIWCVGYGLNTYDKLFTNRQLIALSTYKQLIADIVDQIEFDAITAGMKNDHLSLSRNGSEARAYAEAIAVYLAFALNRMTDIDNALCGWSNSRGQTVHLFGRQAIPMTWDFAENNVFNNAAGDFMTSLSSIIRAINGLTGNAFGEAKQCDAQEDCKFQNIIVSTDPPYYDNISYADLSDFFYVWMRRSLKDIYPDLFNTVLVPKQEELIASPYRFEGDMSRAKDFFEDGMLETCKRIYQYSREDIPVTIYYAYKQNDSDKNTTTVSNGWETMLSAIINAGFAITGTWPMRTEKEGRMIANGTNALASSIILVCRKRSENAPQVTRRNLISILRKELRPALKRLQNSNIAPVDLAQSAIGPGMGVFSRYRRVLEADGSSMTVRSALQVINEEIDLYFNEQVGDLDAMSRFCVDLYTQNAFNDIKFGDADILARAKGTSVAALSSHDVVYAKAGTVHLIERTELPDKIDNNESCIWMLTQQLTQAMATGGVEACAKAVFMMFGSNAERAKDLAYRLYTIAEQKKWSTEAFAYNALVVAWPDIQSRAAMMQREKPEQLDMFSMGLLNT